MALPSDHLRGSLRRTLVPSEDSRPRGRLTFDDVGVAELPEAGRFSSDPSLSQAIGLVREFLRQPASSLLDEIIRKSAGDEFTFAWERSGRPPMKGNWPALYLGYVLRRVVSIKRFWH